MREDRAQIEKEEPMDVNNLKREARTRKSSPLALLACAVFTAISVRSPLPRRRGARAASPCRACGSALGRAWRA